MKGSLRVGVAVAAFPYVAGLQLHCGLHRGDGLITGLQVDAREDGQSTRARLILDSVAPACIGPRMTVRERKKAHGHIFYGAFTSEWAQEPEGRQLTLPPRAAGGLDADLHQDVLSGSFLPTVIGCDCELILMLFAVV